VKGISRLRGLAMTGALAFALLNVARAAEEDWPVYGHDAAGDHYSPLRQITPGNVRTLKEAWRVTLNEPGDSETSPIVVGRTVFAYTPTLKVIAIDGGTGKLLWSFDAGVGGATFTGPARGLAYWSDGKQSRLLAGVMNRLYALDPATGTVIRSFGDDGVIDLRKHLRGDYTQHYVSLTTPGVIYKNLIIVGFRTSETQPAPPGDIRAYDVRTGKLRWVFHTIPRAGELGTQSWANQAWRGGGSANNWAGFALDTKRGIVYAPTGSAVSDFYGADRLGNDLFADTLLALDASTGRRLWHFQGVHHDIWDRDFPSPPVLVTVTHNGKRVDAVAQPTKQGYLYLFDRVTGAPLFPIEELPTPSSDVPGEVASRTQPHPTKPAPYARQRLTVDLLTTRTPEAHAWALQRFHELRGGGQFVPFTVNRPTVVFPGFDGGAEWGGPAVDPTSGVIYINSNDVASTGTLVETAPSTDSTASTIYQGLCSSCHGPDRKGSPPAFPSLVGVADRLSTEQIADVIKSGRGRMPPFAIIPAPAMERLVAYLQTGSVPQSDSQREMSTSLFGAGNLARYRFTGYDKFLDPDGYPAVAPPWGTLNAIDLNTGAYLWKIPLGEYPELVRQGITNTGSENYGGPIVTASGLLFIAATVYDHKIRAFDSHTGALLWEHELPHSGTATPVTYMVDGKQYVAISTSNLRTPQTPKGSAYVAFALP
jgi:quinoprotein glucose dehydrogenase